MGQEPQGSTSRSWGEAHGAKANRPVVALGEQLPWLGGLRRLGLLPPL